MEIVKKFITELYPIMCVVFPCSIYQIFLYRKSNTNKSKDLHEIFWADIFVLYIAMMLNIAGMSTIWDIGKYDEIIRSEEILLIPFQSEGTLTYILNIIMFVPLGVLMPFIWEKYQSLKKLVSIGASLSICIEIAQLFNRRKTDIDDFLMNTLGTIIGFGVWYVCNKIFKIQKTKIRSEALIYILSSLFGRIFLYNWRFLVKIFFY